MRSAQTLVLTSTPQRAPEDEAPRLDFGCLAHLLGARLLYPPATRGGRLVRFLEAKTASDWRQAWQARRTPARLYVSLSEKIGVPLALLRPRGGHVLVAHHLASPAKRALQKRTGFLRRFDKIIVLSRREETYLLDEVGLPPDRVRRLYHSVDSRFWAPKKAGQHSGNYVLSVGREKRDYATLIEAVRPLTDVPTIIVASSPWARSGGGVTQDVPPHVSLQSGGLPYARLRALYQNAALVVVPLLAGTEYAAGSTGVLEAQAMQKPVIVSGTPGIVDYAAHERDAVVVPPADPAALRNAITQLRGDCARAEGLAQAGRTAIEHERNLDFYVGALARIAGEVPSR